MTERIGIREFARREGCDESLVRRGVKQGRLPRADDGLLDASLVGGPWRARRPAAGAKQAKTAGTAVERLRTSQGVRSKRHGEVRTSETAPALRKDRPDESIEETARRLADQAEEDDAIPAYAESLAKKEFYIAKLRQLEYDREVGRVVLVEDVAKEVGEQLATVRSRLLAIPADHAPRLARLNAPAEMQDALHGLLTNILEGLTVDQAGLAAR